MTHTRPLSLIAGSLACLLLGTGCFEHFTQHAAPETPAAEATPNADKAATKPDADAAPAPGKAEAGAPEMDKPVAGKTDTGKPEADKPEGGAAVAGESDEVKLIQFTPEQLKAHGVKVATAGPGRIDQTLQLPGEVAVNADHVAHILPRLAGVIQRLTKNIGDSVHQGEVLAVIDSRGLAEAKSAYAAAAAQVKMAQATRDREQKLFEKGVSAEEDYISAQNALKQAQLQQRAAAQTLSALGVGAGQLAQIASAPDGSLTRYEVRATSNGRVLEKHVSTGQMVSTETEMYLIADLSTVWVNLNVGQKDLPRIKEGEPVRIRFNPGELPGQSKTQDDADTPGIPDAMAVIKNIDALVAEDTRSATARVVLPNPHGTWRPGMFIAGFVTTGNRPAAVVIPLSAVVPVEDHPTVFVQQGDSFEPRQVVLGRQSATQAEVVSGLKAGEQFVSDGAFMVKADLGKSEAGGD